MTLGLLLAPGIKGCFCAIGLFGLLASQATMLHGYGSTIMQDVILPGRKKLLTPESHVRLLKLSVCGVAVFACAFSVIFKPVDYLMMLMKLIGAIYLGGVGVVVWGGLYWQCVSVGLILWACFVARPSGEWWFRYSMVVYVYINLAVAVVTTVWFIWGVSRDLRQLFADLSKEKPDASDDGTVR